MEEHALLTVLVTYLAYVLEIGRGQNAMVTINKK